MGARCHARADRKSAGENPGVASIARRGTAGNQARLRTLAHTRCIACEEKHDVKAVAHAQSVPATTPVTPTAAPPATAPAATTPATPTSVDVWGLPVTRSMCGCRPGIRSHIAWANTAAATYQACNTPANATGTDVEACFDLAQPTSVVVASTSSSGVMTLPPASADPCERINNKATFVHETMHARHTDAIARAQGSAFFARWRALAGDPNRVDTLRPLFPTEITAFEAQWNDGADWASDEVHSYTWERRFLEDTLRALNTICS